MNNSISETTDKAAAAAAHPPTVHLLFFAAVREQMGTAAREVALKPGDTPLTVAERVLGSARSLLFAVNDDLVSADHVLQPGDRLAFIPPMAGG